MKVKDFMISDVIDVKRNETVETLLKKLVTHKIGGVPVVDDANQLIGMISDGDVLRALAPKEQTTIDFYTVVVRLEKQEISTSVEQMLSSTVDQIMTKRKLYYVQPEDDFEQVLNILTKHHFKKIPVIDQEDKVVGVISRGDVIRYITQQMIKE